MPAGPATLGFVYFAAAKFAGYTAFYHWTIRPQLADAAADTSDFVRRTTPIPLSWKAGALRTLIGIVIGAIVGFGFWKIPYFAHHSDLDQRLFFIFLVPVRVCEWLLLLQWVDKSGGLTNKQTAGLIFAGIVASFLLDALGIFAAFILPGGMWIC